MLDARAPRRYALMPEGIVPTEPVLTILVDMALPRRGSRLPYGGALTGWDRPSRTCDGGTSSASQNWISLLIETRLTPFSYFWDAFRTRSATPCAHRGSAVRWLYTLTPTRQKQNLLVPRASAAACRTLP